jgi:hypothetical protein
LHQRDHQGSGVLLDEQPLRATVCIHVPTLLTNEAIHTARKAGCRSGTHTPSSEEVAEAADTLI